MRTATCPHLPGDGVRLLPFPAASSDPCREGVSLLQAPRLGSHGTCQPGPCVMQPFDDVLHPCGLLWSDWAPCLSLPVFSSGLLARPLASSLKCTWRACPLPGPPRAAVLWLLSTRPWPSMPLTLKVGPCLHCPLTGRRTRSEASTR